MLQCPKCGTENLLNAIFCRGCGERLELDELQPDDFLDKPKKGEKITKIINITLAIILTVLIITISVGALFPVSGRLPESEPSSESLASYNSLLKRGRSRSYTFTNEEASALVNRQFKTFSGTAGLPTPELVTVIFQDDGDIKLILTAKLKFLTMHSVVIVTPSVPNQGNVNLSIKSAKLGFLPLPEALYPQILGNFKTIANSTLDTAQKRIAGVTVSGGTVEIERIGRAAPRNAKK